MISPNDILPCFHSYRPNEYILWAIPLRAPDMCFTGFPMGWEARALDRGDLPESLMPFGGFCMGAVRLVFEGASYAGKARRPEL